MLVYTSVSSAIRTYIVKTNANSCVRHNVRRHCAWVCWDPYLVSWMVSTPCGCWAMTANLSPYTLVVMNLHCALPFLHTWRTMPVVVRGMHCTTQRGWCHANTTHFLPRNLGNSPQLQYKSGRVWLAEQQSIQQQQPSSSRKKKQLRNQQIIFLQRKKAGNWKCRQHSPSWLSSHSTNWEPSRLHQLALVSTNLPCMPTLSPFVMQILHSSTA